MHIKVKTFTYNLVLDYFKWINYFDTGFMPGKNGKVYPIGQTINADKFTPKSLIDYPIIKLDSYR